MQIFVFTGKTRVFQLDSHMLLRSALRHICESYDTCLCRTRFTYMGRSLVLNPDALKTLLLSDVLTNDDTLHMLPRFAHCVCQS